MVCDEPGPAATFCTTLPDDQQLHIHLDWKLADENHRDMGGFEMAATIVAVPGGLQVRGQFRKARTRMEPVECIASVGEGKAGSTVPFGADGLVLTTASSFETSFGHCYLCVAVSRVVGLGEGWGMAGGLVVRKVTAERVGGWWIGIPSGQFQESGGKPGGARGGPWGRALGIRM
ncbi:MAG: hypothetical protein GY930_21670 [bacterium]|nr:hypothetical protein [bacterium]